MRKKEKEMPDVFVAASWDVVYGDKSVPIVGDLIRDIPTVVILHHAAKWMNFLVYAQMADSTRQTIWNELRRGLAKDKKNRMLRFMRRTPNWCIATHETLSYLIQLSISNLRKFADEDDTDLELTLEECDIIFDAILCLNSLWQNQQMKDISDQVEYKDAINLSLRLDLPIVEFKIFKDFKTQLFKAIVFFSFLENDPHYKNVLPLFYSDHNVTDWRDYLLKLFGFLEAAIKTPYVRVSPKEKYAKEVSMFLQQFVVDYDDPNVKNFNPAHSVPPYYRDHFLVAISKEIYLLLNPNLLVDKFFQGLKFQIFQTIKKHNFLSPKNKSIKDQPTFNSLIGVPFSEKTLLHKVCEMAFPKKYCRHLTEDDFDRVGKKETAPDYYLHWGDNLFIIECKDLTLGDQIKYSTDIGLIRNELLDRLCLFQEPNSKGKVVNKGAGQLHFVIENIFENSLVDGLDSNIDEIGDIYPIIITTDRAFSAKGVNALVVEKYAEIMKRSPLSYKGFIHLPTIIEMDTLIHLSYQMANGILDIEKELKEYHNNNYGHLKPFSSVMYVSTSTDVKHHRRKLNIFLETSSRKDDLMFMADARPFASSLRYYHAMRNCRSYRRRLRPYEKFGLYRYDAIMRASLMNARPYNDEKDRMIKYLRELITGGHNIAKNRMNNCY